MIRVGQNLYLKAEHISGFSEPVTASNVGDRLMFEVFLVGGQTLPVAGNRGEIEEITIKLTAALEIT